MRKRMEEETLACESSTAPGSEVRAHSRNGSRGGSMPVGGWAEIRSICAWMG